MLLCIKKFAFTNKYFFNQHYFFLLDFITELQRLFYHQYCSILCCTSFPFVHHKISHVIRNTTLAMGETLWRPNKRIITD